MLTLSESESYTKQRRNYIVDEQYEGDIFLSEG